jgi:DNA mismatch repair protein MutS
LVRPAAPAPGSAALEKLRAIEPDGLTPKEALQALYDLRSLLPPGD